MENYYILNQETGKIELHFEKETYLALADEQREKVKRNFVWGRKSGCWISRAKWPNTWSAENAAKEIGLTDAGKTGERLSFAEQMERKAERAERRAERYDGHAEAAEKRGEQLQAPINAMHGDIAFFTQPNINTSAGRAFKNRRDRMFAAFDKGFEEFRKSEYWQERAKAARKTAAMKGLDDPAFIERRIREREKDIRALKKSIEGAEKAMEYTRSGGTEYIWTGDSWFKPAEDREATERKIQGNIDRWLDMLEAKMDELGFYQDALEKAGGIKFSRDNIKPGYIVSIKKYPRDRWKVYSTGPKNFKAMEMSERGGLLLTFQYAEIRAVLQEGGGTTSGHPYRVYDQFRPAEHWGKYSYYYPVDTVFTIIKATDKMVTIEERQGDKIIQKFVRRPIEVKDGEWTVRLEEHYWSKSAADA